MPIESLGVTAESAIEIEGLMAEPREHHRFSDTLIRYRGPTNPLDGSAIDQSVITGAGGSIVMRVYDAGKTSYTAEAFTRIRSAASSGAGSVEVPHFTPQFIENGDVLRMHTRAGSCIRSSSPESCRRRATTRCRSCLCCLPIFRRPATCASCRSSRARRYSRSRSLRSSD